MAIALTLHNHIPCVDSRLIAERLGIQHSVLIRNIKKYTEQFQQLGQLSFENAVGGSNNPQKYIFLNEDQAVFALTLSRNTKEVVQLKLELTLAFAKAKALDSDATNATNAINAFAVEKLALQVLKKGGRLMDDGGNVYTLARLQKIALEQAILFALEQRDAKLTIGDTASYTLADLRKMTGGV
jgi:phage regulator Rha-like protein